MRSKRTSGRIKEKGNRSRGSFYMIAVRGENQRERGERVVSGERRGRGGWNRKERSS